MTTPDPEEVPDAGVIVSSARRMRFVRVLRVLSLVLGIAAVALIIALYVDSALVHHQYQFWSTEQYPLALAGAFLLVLAANAFFWSRWSNVEGWSGAVPFVALVVLSPIAVFILVLVMSMTTPRF